MQSPYTAWENHIIEQISSKAQGSLLILRSLEFRPLPDGVLSMLLLFILMILRGGL